MNNEEEIEEKDWKRREHAYLCFQKGNKLKEIREYNWLSTKLDYKKWRLTCQKNKISWE